MYVFQINRLYYDITGHVLLPTTKISIPSSFADVASGSVRGASTVGIPSVMMTAMGVAVSGSRPSLVICSCIALIASAVFVTPAMYVTSKTTFSMSDIEKNSLRPKLTSTIVEKVMTLTCVPYLDIFRPFMTSMTNWTAVFQFLLPGINITYNTITTTITTNNSKSLF